MDKGQVRIGEKYLDSQQDGYLFRQIKQGFNYLFDNDRYTAIYEENINCGEHEILILESAACRIKFYKSRGEVNLLSGTVFAALGWEDVVNGNRQWFYVRSILDFLERRPLKLDRLMSRAGQHISIEKQIGKLSQSVEPKLEQIESLFQICNFQQWQHEFQQYEQEQEREFERQWAEREQTRKA